MCYFGRDNQLVKVTSKTAYHVDGSNRIVVFVCFWRPVEQADDRHRLMISPIMRYWSRSIYIYNMIDADR
jgi:hypothetical protein